MEHAREVQEVAAAVEEVEVETKVKAKEVEMQLNAGPTSRRARTILLLGCVRNITSMGSQLIGVRSQPLAHGKTSGFRRTSNETKTSLISMTYKTFCITTSIRKYMPPLF